MTIKKCNFLIFLMVVVIITLVASTGNQVSSSISTEIDNFNSIGATTEPSSPSDSTTAQPTAPLFTNGWKAFNYAYDKYVNGKGHQSTTVQVIDAVGAKQTVRINRWKNQQQAYMQVYCEGVIDKYEGLFQADGKVFQYEYPGKVEIGSSPDNGQLKTYNTYQEFLNTGRFLPCTLPHTFNTKTSTITHFINTGKTYTLKLVLDPATCENYRQEMKNISGSSLTPNIKTISFEFTINVATGNFIKIKKLETYTVKLLGLSFDCSSQSYETFSKCDQVVDFETPSFVK